MNKIKFLRKKHGMKQTELCRLLNIVQGTLSGWENGKFEPDVSSLIKMSQIFNESIDFILTGRENAALPQQSNPSVYLLEDDSEAAVSADSSEYFPESKENCFYAIISDGRKSADKISSDIYTVRRVDEISGELPVIVNVNGKYLIRWPYKVQGGIVLTKEKPSFISDRDINEGSVKIIGEVVEKRKLYKNEV